MLGWYLADPKRTENLKTLLALKAKGIPVPSLDSMPRILPQHQWLWQGFCFLSARRWRFDGCPQPIPLSEMLAYSSHEECDAERRTLLIGCVGALDALYMEDYWKRADERHRAAEAKRQRRPQKR